jgi:hypothetical protein
MRCGLGSWVSCAHRGVGGVGSGVGGTLGARHGLVMAGELVLQRVLCARAPVQVDVVVAGHGERLAVGGEGVVGDGVVEQVVDVRGGHGGGSQQWQ